MAINRKPSIYIPTLYFAEGLPYTIVKMMSVIFFKNFGATNEFIGVVTNLLALPWTIKPLWSAAVDIYSTKRTWILSLQLVLLVLIAILAAVSLFPVSDVALVVCFAAIAVGSATHDIAIDGYYLDVLGSSQQAFYVGFRNAAYKVAWLFGAGGLVFLAGKISESLGMHVGWSVSFGVCAAVFLLAFCFHLWYLPEPAKSVTNPGEHLSFTWPVFVKVFATYFQRPRIMAIVTYILIFRAGDAFMLSMAQPFLLDPVQRGGLAISTAQVGLIYGTVGTIALLAGGIVGGWLVAKDGLKRWLMPSAVLQNSAILLYWLLALLKPAVGWVAGVNAIEQFSYGLGVSAYTVFLLGTVKPEFKAAHYAIATGMMALGLMVPGVISGYLETAVGYANFFLISFLSSIPGIITILFLPVGDGDGKAAS